MQRTYHSIKVSITKVQFFSRPLHQIRQDLWKWKQTKFQLSISSCLSFYREKNEPVLLQPSSSCGIGNLSVMTVIILMYMAITWKHYFTQLNLSVNHVGAPKFDRDGVLMPGIIEVTPLWNLELNLIVAAFWCLRLSSSHFSEIWN